MYRIFLAEDDPVTARLTARHLETLGYEVCCAADFADLMPALTGFAPHLVLLDLSLPYRNGYHWCRLLRRQSDVPIVFLSSASDNLNIVTAMDLGADDFLPKPYDLDVLAAKVQAILRRAYRTAPSPVLPLADGAELEPGTGELRTPAGTVTLTRNELRILQMLLENRGRTVRRDTLMTRLWSTDCFVDENTLTVNVGRLRRKLDAAGLGGRLRTVKGEGYLLA
ncbi:MAG: response regulator transcription factor [Gemmiger sp.]|uniref:response regulator transcription factor n=1 Tax=Gemmiger sp. TaxID=2049027 RepID=UPI002E7919ED|nr:response regulator transcription factor [Gemmiger sp.]MEE0801229.1 response regulator transcription factor [Gemmiger sp.]